MDTELGPIVEGEITLLARRIPSRDGNNSRYEIKVHTDDVRSKLKTIFLHQDRDGDKLFLRVKGKDHDTEALSNHVCKRLRKHGFTNVHATKSWDIVDIDDTHAVRVPSYVIDFTIHITDLVAHTT